MEKDWAEATQLKICFSPTSVSLRQVWVAAWERPVSSSQKIVKFLPCESHRTRSGHQKTTEVRDPCQKRPPCPTPPTRSTPRPRDENKADQILINNPGTSYPPFYLFINWPLLSSLRRNRLWRCSTCRPSWTRRTPAGSSSRCAGRIRGRSALAPTPTASSPIRPPTSRSRTDEWRPAMTVLR